MTDPLAPFGTMPTTGITMKDEAPSDPRIKATPGGMTSHVVPITAADQIDDDVVRWLRLGYDRG
jgi:hypothetical protein